MSSPQGTFLLTGANGGLACEFVDQFLNSPHATSCKAIYTVRDPSTSHSLHATLKHAPKDHAYEILPLDLRSLSSVRNFAASVNDRVAAGDLPPIRALVLHAGVNTFKAVELTPEDKLEIVFEVNYAANFLLVILLLQSMDRKQGRIVHIGSRSHDPKKNEWLFKPEQTRDMFTDLEKMSRGEVTMDETEVWKLAWKRYGMSKALMVMFTYELQRRLSRDHVLSEISTVIVDPGSVGGTGMVRTAPVSIRIFLVIMSYLQTLTERLWPNGTWRTAAKVGKDTLYACFDEETLGESLKVVYLDGMRAVKSSEETYDEEKQRALWEGSLNIVGVGEGITMLKDWK